MARNRRRETEAVDTDEDDFDAGTALENLRGEVEGIEALAHAAAAVLEDMPARPKDPGERRAMGRLYVLVEAVAEAAEATLDSGNELVARLGRQLARRRGER